MNQIIIAIIGSGALSAIISAIISAINERSRSREVDQLLLLDALKHQAKDALADGFISARDLECIEVYYMQYKAYGGNGFADTLMAKVRALNLKD